VQIRDAGGTAFALQRGARPLELSARICKTFAKDARLFNVQLGAARRDLLIEPVRALRGGQAGRLSQDLSLPSELQSA
jgi:hypothetical protein